MTSGLPLGAVASVHTSAPQHSFEATPVDEKSVDQEEPVAQHVDERSQCGAGRRPWSGYRCGQTSCDDRHDNERKTGRRLLGSHADGTSPAEENTLAQTLSDNSEAVRPRSAAVPPERAGTRFQHLQNPAEAGNMARAERGSRVGTLGRSCTAARAEHLTRLSRRRSV
jgi:hypothetical protein